MILTRRSQKRPTASLSAIGIDSSTSRYLRPRKLTAIARSSPGDPERNEGKKQCQVRLCAAAVANRMPGTSRRSPTQTSVAPRRPAQSSFWVLPHSRRSHAREQSVRISHSEPKPTISKSAKTATTSPGLPEFTSRVITATAFASSAGTRGTAFARAAIRPSTAASQIEIASAIENPEFCDGGYDFPFQPRLDLRIACQFEGTAAPSRAADHRCPRLAPKARLRRIKRVTAAIIEVWKRPAAAADTTPGQKFDHCSVRPYPWFARSLGSSGANTVENPSPRQGAVTERPLNCEMASKLREYRHVSRGDLAYRPHGGKQRSL